MAAFAKYDGIDGEAIDVNHDKWIDVLSIDWGAHKPGGGMTGQSRRRGAGCDRGRADQPRQPPAGDGEHHHHPPFAVLDGRVLRR